MRHTVHLKLHAQGPSISHVVTNLPIFDPLPLLLSFLLVRNSCHIRHLTKCPNWCWTWNICFLLIFSWKMLQPNFAFWDIFVLLTCLNSKEIKLQSSIRVICIIFDLIFFQLKIKRKQIFQVWHQFGHFVKCRIWHEKHTSNQCHW